MRQENEITVEDSEDSENLTSNWQFSLFELDGSHYAAVCMEKDKIADGKKISLLFSILWQFSRPQELPFCSYFFQFVGRGNEPMRLKVWKTLPFVKDEFVSGTDAVTSLNGLSWTLNLKLTHFVLYLGVREIHLEYKQEYLDFLSLRLTFENSFHLGPNVCNLWTWFSSVFLSII